MSFHYTDPDDDHLRVEPLRTEDGPHIALQIPCDHNDIAAVRIPVDRVEEFIAGLRDTARDAAKKRP